MVDIYNRRVGYERLKKRMADWPIAKDNRRYVQHYVRNHIDRRSPGRRYSDLCLLKRLFLGTTHGKYTFAALITKSFGELTLEDFEQIRERCNREAQGQDTYEKLTRHLRNLYEDAFGDDPDKRTINDALFRVGRRRFFRWPSDRPTNDSIDARHYYTFDEFTRILRVARLPKEQALLALAWETTSRPNEYLSLTVGDVEPLTQGFRIRAHISKGQGKAPTRFLYLFTFCAEFNEFWSRHPHRDVPRAPLFYREDQAGQGKPLSGHGANKLLKKYDRLAGVNKNGTLYFLRHGGYTWKRLQGMNPALAGKDMGWAPGGREERRYLHLTEAEVMKERLRLATGEAIEEPAATLKPRVCPFCQATNSPLWERCRNCGQSTDVRKLLKQIESLHADQETLIDAKLRAIASRYGLDIEKQPAPSGSPN